jgi:predicted amidohydrolase YtcJ
VTALLLRDAEVDGRPGTDVRLVGGRVTEVGHSLRRAPGEEIVDVAGGAVLPGLCDAHLHLMALAAAQTSVRCGPPDVTGPGELAAALAAAAPDADGWVRGIGYAESVAGLLDASTLDRLHESRPVRLQHRSGALWTVNSRGAELLGLGGAAHPGVERTAHGAPTGRLWRADDWLRGRLPVPGPPALAGVGLSLARLGITSVTDATPDLDDGALALFGEATASGALPQRVHLLGAPLAAGELGGRLSTGPYKLVLADSALPDLDTLAARITAAHAAGRAVAVHCVTREALVLLVAALRMTGVRPGDRLEHAALVPPELLPELGGSGLRVVTQPGFLADRGDDYLADVPTGDLPDLYRCASLLDAGVPVALSSDAPYGPVDPWAVVAAAAGRRTRSGAVAGADERIPADRALEAYLAEPDDPGGRPRRIGPGLTEVVVLDRPLVDQLSAPEAAAVRLVVVDGRVIEAG